MLHWICKFSSLWIGSGLTSEETQAKGQDRDGLSGDVWLRSYVPARMKKLSEWVGEFTVVTEKQQLVTLVGLEWAQKR